MGYVSKMGQVGLCSALFFCASAVADEFQSPWLDPGTSIVIDAYSANSIDWEKLASDKRVVGIIHKATEGGRTDPAYARRKAEAQRRGYLWGSYHLGLAGDPVKQADFYLNTIGSDPTELLALDLESLGPRHMSIASARKFMERVHERVGRYPIVYANHAVAAEITRISNKDDVFGRVPLWYARFRDVIPNFPTGIWRAYTLWQFSSEINCNKKKCPYRVPGTQADMDVNVYFGAPEDLRSAWPFTRMSIDPSKAHIGEHD